MTATQQKPVYSVYIVSGSTKYNVTNAVISQDRSEPDGQIAQRVTLQLANIKVNGDWLSSLLKARDRVFIYANDGTQEKEVFRGYLWTRARSDSISDGQIQYTCYDNLIYFQESEDSLYFTSGKSTEDIMSTICKKWGIKLKYSYDSITHTKLPLRGYLSDIFTGDILDLVKKRTGKKYVILSDQDTMIVRPVGANATIYHFEAGKNISQTASGWTMDGVITKVIIVGKADGDDREPIEATVAGKTSEYGTLQKIQRRSENTTLADAKIEAKNTIDENGKPKWEYEITAPDVPWIRKGDKIYVNAGEIVGNRIITEVDRSIDQKHREMTLHLEDV